MVKNVHMRRRRSVWPWNWSSRFSLPVEDTEVTQVDKRAASFVPQQTQDKNAMGNECFRQLILFFIHFSAFSQAACVKRALNHVPILKIEVHVLLHFLLLCLWKIDILAVTNTQAQHPKKEVRNHFFVQEITSPTSNRYMYFVSFIIESQPSVEWVELQLPTVLQ